MEFIKPVLEIESQAEEIVSTSDAEKTSTYDEVWTTWLESNV